MIFEGLIGPVFVCICIAVYAAVWTGIIRANVCALCAAALVPCGFFFVLQTPWIKQLFNDAAVDTMRFFNFRSEQIIAAA